MVRRPYTRAVRSGPLSTRRKVLRGVIALLLLGSCLPGPLEALVVDYGADLGEPLPARARGHYEAMAAHFRAPFRGYGLHETLTSDFDIVLLSNAALGFMNVAAADPERGPEVRRLLDEVARRALLPEVSPYGEDPRDVDALGDHNLYLSHLHLVLGARRRAGGDGRYDALYERVNDHLVRRSSHPSAHARSYPGSARFPADQLATLAGIHLYDLTRGTDTLRRPLARWRRFMAREGSHRSGLFVSAVTPYPRRDQPRGCALSWSTLYLAQFAPDLARAQYATYRERFFLHRAGLGGFREYLPQVRAPMDVDSGPIVAGMGVAATGFGIGAARIMGDREGYRAMMRTAATVGLPQPLSRGRQYALAPRLGEAILFHGMTARRWDGPAPEPLPAAPEAPFPVAPLMLSALWIVWAARNLAWLRG